MMPLWLLTGWHILSISAAVIILVILGRYALKSRE
jgi:hypothetical protein